MPLRIKTVGAFFGREPLSPLVPERRILIVDDEPFNLIGLRVILNNVVTNIDHLIDTAKNGLEAFEAAKHGTYGLIFMDCSMPIMDGYEATVKIR